LVLVLDEFLKNESLDSDLRDYAKTLIAEDKGEEDPWPVILDCIKRLMKVNLRSKEIALQRQIQLTASSGDLDLLKKLEQQKFELATKIRELGVFWK